MSTKNKIISAVLSAAIAFGTFSAPAFEITSYAYSVSAASASADIPKLDISDSSYIKYTYGKKNFAVKNLCIYNFSDEMHTGIGGDYKSHFGEMYAGIYAKAEKNVLKFNLYSNSKAGWQASKVKIVSDEKETVLNVKDAASPTRLDTSGYANGLYKIEMDIKLSGDKKTAAAEMYFYVNGGRTYLCSCTQMYDLSMKRQTEREKLIDRLIKESGITPENSLSTEQLCFPWHPSVGNNDIPKWIKLAKEITKEEWSDSLKAFAIHEWMTKNLAYDRYKTDVIKDMRRSDYYNDRSGKYEAYKTKVGVCFDFANIYAAMCRSVGVPVVTLDTEKHCWNLVYLDGKWREVDLTTDVKRKVYGEDMTEIRNADKIIYCYKGYCAPEVNRNVPEEINRWLMTYETIAVYN